MQDRSRVVAVVLSPCLFDGRHQPDCDRGGRDHRHHVATHQSQIVQIIVGQPFTAKVGVDKPQPPETSNATTQSPDVG